MDHRAQHWGIHRIQDLFLANADRLYHWAEDRRIPAENRLTERDLGPTVIAREVSCGSQSDSRARTRGILTSVLHTLTGLHCSSFKVPPETEGLRPHLLRHNLWRAYPERQNNSAHGSRVPFANVGAS
jgi:hypothetical protein